MITRQMLFPLAFYKKAKFTGSKGKQNYRIEKKEEQLILTAWEGPECYDVSQKPKEISTYPFDEEGMHQIIDVLNTM